MPVLQPTPRKSFTKSAALGRRLNAQRTTSQSVLVATVEILNESREVIVKPGKLGTLYLLRSTADATRYYPITCRDGVYETTVECERTNKRLISRLQAWLKSQAETVAA